LNAFSTIAKLPISGNLRPRDNDALNEWVKSECTPEDIESAIEYATNNELTIVGPASIHKGVMVARSRRLREPKQKSTLEMLNEAGYK